LFHHHNPSNYPCLLPVCTKLRYLATSATGNIDISRRVRLSALAHARHISSRIAYWVGILYTFNSELREVAASMGADAEKVGVGTTRADSA